MTTSTRQNVRTGLRWFLGLLMLWAAVSKLGNPTDFLGSIYAYDRPFPRSLIQVVAVVLPWVELLCGLLLLSNQWTESALACVSALMAVFVLATGQAWLRQLEISCGCFNLQLLGIAEGSGIARFVESVGFAFFRNLVLTGMAVFLLRERLSELQPASPAAATPPARPAKRAMAARA
jgi:putative oxidoreductase